MALNKFMHPRNIYKIPPDFEKLSRLYPEFANIAKMDVTGKVILDFKDPHALRVLTKCLLKLDFNLDVEIPEDRLVPTLPLRLNYILWIEDLMTAVQRNLGIRGIDIGTGACAVYPLLAAVKNKWQMVATEVDSISLQKAQENITRNNLQELIKLKESKGSQLIESLFSEENGQKFDFCMCNPPFYSNLQELFESRSPARLPPKNGFTGSPRELITEGGELNFCRKLIDESKRCKDHVLIFTTMVGHKYNMSELLQDLKADGVKHTHTEFCQGRVTRWGLAWTYQNHDIHHLVPPREKIRKKSVPIAHELPQLPDMEYNVQTAYNKIKTMFIDLQIEQKILNMCGKRITLDVLAKENTWSNQRRKRRLLKKIEIRDGKKLKLERNKSTDAETNGSNSETTDSKKLNSNGDGSFKVETIESNLRTTDGKKNSDADISKNGVTNETNPEITDCKKLKFDGDGFTNVEMNESNSKPTDGKKLHFGRDGFTCFGANENNPETTFTKNLSTDGDRTNVSTLDTKSNDTKYEAFNQTHLIKSLKLKENKLNSGSTQQANNISTKETEPIFHAFVNLYRNDKNILLEIEFLSGIGGKESVHQVMQYIKNNWK